MRRFSKEEREIIHRLVDGEGFTRNVVNLLDKSLSGVRVAVKREESGSQLLFEKGDRESEESVTARVIEQGDQISKTLLLHLSLIKYLINNDLVLLYQPGKRDKGGVEFGQGAVNAPSVGYMIADSALSALILEFADKEIIPTYHLVKLVNDKFKTPEEQRFQKQMHVAWTAIVVSILIGLVGVFLNLCGEHNNSLQPTAIPLRGLSAAELKR